MIVVVLFTIFLMALVSLNSDYRVAVSFKLCAGKVYLFSTYLKAESPLIAVTQVVGNFL